MKAGMRHLARAIVLFAAAGAVAAGLSAAAPAAKADSQHLTISPAELSSARHVNLGLGKSLVIDLPRDAKDVLVSNPVIADAVMRTARRAYLIGVEAGETNVFFFDEVGRQIAVLEVNVTRDLGALSRTIRQHIPGSNVRVEAMEGNIVLSGTVNTPADAANAASLAARFAGDPERVMNMINAKGSEQVHLKVTVAEIQRNVLKQFGIDVEALIKDGSQLLVATQTPFGLGSPISESFGRVRFGNQRVGDTFEARLRAMEQTGVLRILAEPTLSAISGESAEFLAGGEFPVPVGQTCDPETGLCQLAIDFKEFGVGLAFTPVVHTGGRMTIKVRTEVSELTADTAVVLQGTAIPGLNTRRADTTVELPSGGSLVLAGLLRNDVRQVVNGVPGLKDLPILGTLFRSRDYQNDETELVVIATPYLVNPTSPDQLARPDRNFKPASDPAAVLLGRLNRIYGVAGSAPKGKYHGHVGFIVE